MSDVETKGTDTAWPWKWKKYKPYDEWPLTLDHLPWGISDYRATKDQFAFRVAGCARVWGHDVRLRVFTVQSSVLKTCDTPTSLVLESEAEGREFFEVMIAKRFLPTLPVPTR